MKINGELAIDEINNWENVDLIKFKITPSGLEHAIYYLDGHKVYDETLTELDREIVQYSRKLGCYGNSEVAISQKKDKNQFYVKIDLSNDVQQEKMLSYICQKINLTNKQKEIFEKINNINNLLIEKNEYKSLYFVGFVEADNKNNYERIKFYFQIDYNDESQKTIMNYFEKIECFSKNKAFIRTKELLSEEDVRLKIVGVEFDEAGSYKLKFYLNSDLNYRLLTGLIKDIQIIKINKIKLNYINSIMDNNSNLKISLMQLSNEENVEGCSVGFYIENNNRSQKTYYCLNENIRMRDIGGVKFLVDIHEKNYYDKDKKDLCRINEIGGLIIEYMQNKKVSNIDGIVSWIKSNITNYHVNMNDEIYADCKEFIESLVKEGYICEVN